MKSIKNDNYKQAEILHNEGLTQTQISERLGISEQTICKYAKEWNLKESFLNKNLEFLHSKLEFLLSNENSKPKQIKALITSIKIFKKLYQ